MSNCACNQIPCCCAVTRRANTIYECGCPDPGMADNGRFLSTLDYQFCPRRLENDSGFLVNTPDANGNFMFAWTTEPDVALSTITVVADTAAGALILIGGDGVWREASLPASKWFATNPGGDLILTDLPPSSVPDPLAVNNLNVGVLATIADATITGDVTLSGAALGTVASLLGVDGTGKVVKQAAGNGILSAMFFESASSPSIGTPNINKVSSDYFVIGNQLFDSGGSILTITDSVTLTVAVAGTYLLQWCGQIGHQATYSSFAGIWLEINGIVVNWGTGTNGATYSSTQTEGIGYTGMELRNLAVGDVIRLQASSSLGIHAKSSQIRLSAVNLAPTI